MSKVSNHGIEVYPPIPEPDNDPSLPEERYEIEYVYGYKSSGPHGEGRQNCYLNKDNEAVYHAGSLGIILDHNSNT